MPKPKYDHPVIQKGAVQVFAHLARKPMSDELRQVCDKTRAVSEMTVSWHSGRDTSSADVAVGGDVDVSLCQVDIRYRLSGPHAVYANKKLRTLQHQIVAHLLDRIVHSRRLQNLSQPCASAARTEWVALSWCAFVVAAGLTAYVSLRCYPRK